MKYLLIAMIVASWLGVTVSVVLSAQRHQDLSFLLLLPALLVVNGVCARYLNRKARSNRTEWTLFGFLANINALLVFWLVNNVRQKWKKGEKYFTV